MGGNNNCGEAEMIRKQCAQPFFPIFPHLISHCLLLLESQTWRGQLWVSKTLEQLQTPKGIASVQITQSVSLL